ncbi:LrgB-like family-domain-containing protein [Xylariaceae sp. FL0662B]|nr:LrgB-like family-domain-containing protein [Xylariaceae sp. FL0662B]
MALQQDNALGDLLLAVQIAFRHSRPKIIQQWLYIPPGILLFLLACFGVDKLLKLGSVSFPASVACLVVLFVALLLSEQALGEHRTRRIVAVIEIPGGWSLRWIGIMFMPSFVLLPLSPPIGAVEVFKIIAVFVIGFVVMMALAAYMTRGLQLISGSSKRAMIERAEELGLENDEIPMTATPAPEESPSSGIPSEQASSMGAVEPPPPSYSQSRQDANSEPRTSVQNGGLAQTSLPPQVPVPLSRSSRWAAIITSRFDLFIYTLLFVFVGLPIYYAVGYAMPMHLTFTILTYFAALSLPPNWRQYLHPVLVSSLFTVLGLWVLGLIKGHDLASTLAEYQTGAKYLVLWDGSALRPGAGDMLSSALDAAIVALALPMYQYRRELRQHFLAIVLPNVLISVASLFAYPRVCYAIGISAQRSLAFAARSLTLALATPATVNLGGDTNTVAALAILSGILGVLTGQRILAMLRIPEDDYVTRGVTLGANSSAIATAFFLRTDPRAAALSSLSMSLFGTITVVFTSIPPIVTVVRSLVEL